MSVFATITLNAAVDTTCTLPRLAPGAINRLERKDAVAGGKGNNVARVLACLGHDVTATGFAGGTAGEFIERSLSAEGVVPAFMDAPGESRTCLTLVETGSGRITEIREPGEPVSAELAEAFLDRAPALIGDARAVAICGSLPPGLPDDYLARLCTRLEAPGRFIAVDSSGPPLRQALAAHPSAIAPNLDELMELAGPGAAKHPLPAARALRADSLGPNGLVLVKLGAAGAIAVSSQGAVRAVPSPVDTVNPVGAGDAFLAGWLAAWVADPDHASALRHAVACGAAAVLQARIGVVDPADVARLAPLVRVEAA
jgi:tagatose 6-phosphate kinase